MADIIQCPKCPRKLQVPVAVLGRQVQCPSCGQTFVAGATSESPPAPAPDAALAELYEHVSETQPATIVAPLPSLHIADEPRARELRPLPEVPRGEAGSLADWQKVRQGLQLIWHGLVLGIVTMLSVMCVSCGFSGKANADPGAAVVGLIAMGLVVLAGLTSISLHLFGQVFCLRAPLEQRARTFARISLPLLLLGLGLVQFASLVGFAGSDDLPFAALGDLITHLATLVLLTQLLVFLLYLRALALLIGRQRLATSFRQLMFLVGGISAGVVVLCAAVIVCSLTGTSSSQFGGVFITLACPLVLLGVFFVIWYITALSELQDAVRAYFRRRERQA